MENLLEIKSFSEKEFEDKLQSQFSFLDVQSNLFGLKSQDSSGFFAFTQIDTLSACYLDIITGTQDFTIKLKPEYSTEDIRIIVKDDTIKLLTMVEEHTLPFANSFPQPTIVCVCPKNLFLGSIDIKAKISFIESLAEGVALSRHLKKELDEIKAGIALNNGLFMLQFRSFLLQLLVEIAIKTKVVLAASPNRKKFEKVVQILEEHLLGGFPPTITQMAKDLKVSDSKLKLLFSEYAGMGVYQYYFKKKMELANQLLVSGSHNVSEVSAMLGYSTATKFIVAYKKVFGDSPRRHIHQ